MRQWMENLGKQEHAVETKWNTDVQGLKVTCCRLQDVGAAQGRSGNDNMPSLNIFIWLKENQLAFIWNMKSQKEPETRKVHEV